MNLLSRIAQKLRDFRHFSRRVWTLSAPYFRSEDKWKARGLLVAIVLLNLGAVYMLVLLNEWNRVFYDALQNKDAAVFWTQLARFTYLAFAFIIIAVYRFYLTQLLEVRWRAWMTAHYLQRWLADHAFYKLELARFTGNGDASTGTPDNPDQRIQEDINLFTTYSISLSMGLLNAVVTLVSFVGILWSLSGAFAFNFNGASYSIPGFMVWMAVLYCVAGSVITHYIGRPQIRLNFQQQQVEADFRHHMVRVREYSESIALDKGEAVERAQLDTRFAAVLANYLQLIKKQKNLVWFTNFFGQAAVVFPFIVAAPRFFSGAIQLGELIQISSAFGRVQDSLSWLVDNYSSLAAWRATTDRLTSFEDNISAVAQQGRAQAASNSVANDAHPLAADTLAVSDLSLEAADRRDPAQRRVAAGRAGPERAAQGSVGQRQIDAVPGAGRHLAVCHRPDAAAAGRDVHSAAPLLSRWQPAQCAGLSAARRAVRRRGPAAGADGCAAAATGEPARRRGRLEPEAVGRRAAAAGDCPGAAEKAALDFCRRGDQRARRGGRKNHLRQAAGQRQGGQRQPGVDCPPADRGGFPWHAVGA